MRARGSLNIYQNIPEGPNKEAVFLEAMFNISELFNYQYSSNTLQNSFQSSLKRMDSMFGTSTHKQDYFQTLVDNTGVEYIKQHRMFIL